MHTYLLEKTDLCTPTCRQGQIYAHLPAGNDRFMHTYLQAMGRFMHTYLQEMNLTSPLPAP